MEKYLKLNYVVKVFIFIYTLIQIVINGKVNYEIVILVLLNASICIIKERFNDSLVIICTEFIGITIGAFFNLSFAFLYAINIFDFVYKKSYWGTIFAAAGIIYFFRSYKLFELSSFFIIYALLAYVLGQQRINAEIYKNTFDNERRLRYTLENTKNQLLKSSMELVRIAEIQERNRISRNIHDNIGHSIAAIYMQLQVVNKLYGNEDNKAKEILLKSINGLGDSLEVIRNTVHNIKPKENLGIEYLRSIIDSFNFCPIEFKHCGDFNLLNPAQIQLILTNIKEGLTNASRYSNATKINISIEINDKYFTLIIKDNGVGAKKINEGLGLSGMRERCSNMGGTLSISGENGFSIICVTPLKASL